eukprot:Polyplicarium_translucidae@DN3609_c0_g1_i1.p1
MDATKQKQATIRCATCETALPAAPGWKDHYKTDYHAFNLRRKMAEKSVVSEDTFASLMANAAARAAVHSPTGPIRREKVHAARRRPASEWAEAPEGGAPIP